MADLNGVTLQINRGTTTPSTLFPGELFINYESSLKNMLFVGDEDHNRVDVAVKNAECAERADWTNKMSLSGGMDKYDSTGTFFVNKTSDTPNSGGYRTTPGTRFSIGYLDFIPVQRTTFNTTGYDLFTANSNHKVAFDGIGLLNLKGLSLNTSMYGNTLPENPEEGQIYFLLQE